MNLFRLLVPLADAASLTDKGSETAEQSEAAVTDFVSFLWNSLDNWIAAIIVVVFSVYFAKMLKKIVVDKVADKMGDEHEEILVLVGRATYAAILGVGLTIGLKVGGIDLTVIIAAVGFGIGFALQDIIMNFIAGVILLATRQFAIGDFIEVNGTFGQVKEIQSRATILHALDGTKVIVPNSELFTNQVISYTTNPFRRIEVPVGVEYRTDLKKATNVMLAVLHAHDSVVKEPAPAVILDEFSDSSINFKVRFWVQSKDQWIQIKSDMIQLLKAALDEAGINIPFPIRTLVFDKNTEKVTIPTYAMTPEEMQQHKMEQIQAQEEQSQKDAANPALQKEQINGSGQLEHENLQDLEEKHAVESQKSEIRSQEETSVESRQSEIRNQEEAEVSSTQSQVSQESKVEESPKTPVPSQESRAEEAAPQPVEQPKEQPPVDATATVTPAKPAPEVVPAAEASADTGTEFLNRTE